MRVLVCAGVCVLLLVVGARPVFGQEVGIKVGVTSSTLSVMGAPGFDPEADLGLMAGGWISVGGKTFRLQPEVILSSRRFSAPSSGGTIAVSSRAIEIPVLVLARLRPDGRVHPLLFAGPYLGSLRKTTQSVAGVETSLDSELKRTDAGIVAGAGVLIDTRRGAIVLEARYTAGWRNLSTVSGTTFKSRAVMASLGYRF